MKTEAESKSLGELLFSCTGRARHPQWLETRDAMARDWFYASRATKEDWQDAAAQFIKEVGALIEREGKK